MKKVIVIGCPGSGKSYFSKKLHELTNLPLYHMDLLYHNKDGSHITREELTEKLKTIFKNDSWLIDGNYQGTLELRVKECDTIFLLDYPTDICVRGAESRIGTERTDLPWKEDKLNEDFRQEIIEFSTVKLPEIYHLLEQYKDNRDIVVFKDRDEADSYIKVLSRKME